jgi:hypothetical protein
MLAQQHNIRLHAHQQLCRARMPLPVRCSFNFAESQRVKQPVQGRRNRSIEKRQGMYTYAASPTHMKVNHHQADLAAGLAAAATATAAWCLCCASAHLNGPIRKVSTQKLPLDPSESRWYCLWFDICRAGSACACARDVRLQWQAAAGSLPPADP